MKIVVSALLLLVCMSANVNAATCRSGEAAVRGSESGYDEDKKAAEQTVEDELSFSDVLEKCVGGVTGIKAGPTYGPSEIFGDWAEKIFNQVCSLARDKINDTVDGATESRMGSALQSLYSNYDKYAGTINSGSPGTVPSSIGTVSNLNFTSTPAAVQPTQAPVTPSGSTSTSDDSAFWNDIWK
ncbi:MULTISPECIES: hypothetical protein [unclassified Pseudomonas]|uniref:hypothetical protein n=1 Tax=unclassified Pseudomonas TaxID=196821 RepID=UPI0012FE0DEF|nr:MULTISPECIES: hypothetical protein [unclassified Pseudomonas]MCU1738070.1 hypothetical protein [Pseudomonas sp. 20S_6.2_Bac1]